MTDALDVTEVEIAPDRGLGLVRDPSLSRKSSLLGLQVSPLLVHLLAMH